MPLFRKRPPPDYYRGPSAEPPADVSDDVGAFASQVDAYAALRWALSPAGSGGEPQRRCLPVGVTHPRWRFTRPDTHLLALGPPRSHAGKTASIMIPAILQAAGPVVSASTKPDVLSATALARAQMGKLWCFAPDGDTEIPDGVEELRWSPIVGAKDWDVARRSAHDMTAAMSSEDVREGGHWKDRAGAMLGPIFHWAALNDGLMEDVLNAVHNADTAAGIVSWLSSRSPMAASVLNSVTHASQQEVASIRSTASRARRVFEGSAALRTAANPNFDPLEFAWGGQAGRADTVYIMSLGHEQQRVAPLVVPLLGRIRDAVYQVHRTRGNGISTVFALDELYELAPIPELPAMLSAGGSQGLLVVGAVQDLTLIKSRWPKEADAFLTVFGNVLVFPGVRDGHTLDAVSKLIGDWDKPTVTESREWTRGGWVGFPGRNVQPGEWTVKSQQHGTHREALLPPDQIYQGIEPGNPDVLLWLHHNGWEQVTATPWWRSDPWPNVLAACLARAAAGRVPEWRFFESLVTGEHPAVPDLLPYLPQPDLRPWLAQWQDDPQSPWRQRAVRQLLQSILPRLDQLRQSPPAQARWELAPTWTQPGMPWTMNLPPSGLGMGRPAPVPDFFASLPRELQEAVRRPSPTRIRGSTTRSTCRRARNAMPPLPRWPPGKTGRRIRSPRTMRPPRKRRHALRHRRRPTRTPIR